MFSMEPPKGVPEQDFLSRGQPPGILLWVPGRCPPGGPHRPSLPRGQIRVAMQSTPTRGSRRSPYQGLLHAVPFSESQPDDTLFGVQMKSSQDDHT